MIITIFVGTLWIENLSPSQVAAEPLLQLADLTRFLTKVFGPLSAMRIEVLHVSSCF
jgi:hypothetical protein